MGVGRGGRGVPRPRPSLDFEIISKKGCFFNFEGKKQISPLLIPPAKILGKSPTGHPLEKVLPTPMLLLAIR